LDFIDTPYGDNPIQKIEFKNKKKDKKISVL